MGILLRGNMNFLFRNHGAKSVVLEVGPRLQWDVNRTQGVGLGFVSQKPERSPIIETFNNVNIKKPYRNAFGAKLCAL
jgi:hypothetical protein